MAAQATGRPPTRLRQQARGSSNKRRCAEAGGPARRPAQCRRAGTGEEHQGSPTLMRTRRSVGAPTLARTRRLLRYRHVHTSSSGKVYTKDVQPRNTRCDAPTKKHVYVSVHISACGSVSLGRWSNNSRVVVVGVVVVVPYVRRSRTCNETAHLINAPK